MYFFVFLTLNCNIACIWYSFIFIKINQAFLRNTTPQLFNFQTAIVLACPLITVAVWWGSSARLVFILENTPKAYLSFVFLLMVYGQNSSLLICVGLRLHSAAAIFSQFRVLKYFSWLVNSEIFIPSYYITETLKYYSQQCISLYIGRYVYYYYPRIFLL